MNAWEEEQENKRLRRIEEEKRWLNKIIMSLCQMPVLNMFLGKPTGIQFELNTHGNWGTLEHAYFNTVIRTADCPKNFTWHGNGHQITSGFVRLKYVKHVEMYHFDYDSHHSWKFRQREHTNEQN